MAFPSSFMCHRSYSQFRSHMTLCIWFGRTWYQILLCCGQEVLKVWIKAHTVMSCPEPSGMQLAKLQQPQEAIYHRHTVLAHSISWRIDPISLQICGLFGQHISAPSSYNDNFSMRYTTTTLFTSSTCSTFVFNSRSLKTKLKRLARIYQMGPGVRRVS